MKTYCKKLITVRIRGERLEEMKSAGIDWLSGQIDEILEDATTRIACLAIDAPHDVTVEDVQ